MGMCTLYPIAFHKKFLNMCPILCNNISKYGSIFQTKHNQKKIIIIKICGCLPFKKLWKVSLYFEKIPTCEYHFLLKWPYVLWFWGLDGTSQSKPNLSTPLDLYPSRRTEAHCAISEIKMWDSPKVYPKFSLGILIFLYHCSQKVCHVFVVCVCFVKFVCLCFAITVIPKIYVILFEFPKIWLVVAQFLQRPTWRKKKLSKTLYMFFRGVPLISGITCGKWLYF